MTNKSIVILLLINSFFPYFVNSATFENVTVLLTTQLGKLFLGGSPPINDIFIESSDTLSNFVNLQPLEVLTIRNENIPRLSKNSVSDLYNIEHISIISSGIREIQPGTFKNLPKLNGLNLEDNSIEEIRNGVFTGLQIKSLHLNDNKISKIENAAFNNMTMTLINLNNNRISKWKSEWFVGTPLGSIYMAHNLIEELPADAFSYGLQFKKANVPLTVWHLVLYQNRLKKIHPRAFDHVNGFGYLMLSDNNLKNLPKDIFHSVKNINTLDLTNNRINDVERIFDDINIHQLILINNSLSCFPRDVFDVSVINFIFLDGNPLTCDCVSVWKDFQVRNNKLIAYNMQTLEDNCVEQNIGQIKPKQLVYLS